MKYLIFALLCILTSFARAEDATFSTEIDGVEINLWIPDGVKVLRGALVNPADAKVGGGNWGETFRHHGFAHMGLMIRDLKRGGRATVVQTAMDKALKEFAEKSGHPELERIPLCFAGMSKGGGWSAEIAKQLPERTIAFGNICGWIADTKTTTTIFKTPALFVIGGTPDGYKMLDAIPRDYDPARQQGAVWTLALQWGVGHDFANANALLLPFFDAVIPLRLPADANAVSGPVKLKDLNVEDGWLGDRSTWEGNFATIASWADYKGDKSTAVWLPNSYVASVWRAFVSKDAPVRIDAATVDGSSKFPESGKRGIIVPSGTTIVFEAAVKDGFAVKEITFFDGDKPLGKATSAPWRVEWKNPPAGARAVYAQWETPDGSRGVSNPGLVVVKK
jgi:hypothetical protein